MTHYEDLKPYKYWSTGEISEVHNVGWLAKENEFFKGAVLKEFVNKLEQIILAKNDSKCQALVNRMRGFFYCEFCNARSDDLQTQDRKHKLVLGNAELLIPHCGQSAYYFSAPTLVHHYITAHSYLPPKEFIDSVLSLDLETKLNGGTIFRELVEKRGGTYLH